jgi:hypothetical protein
LQPEEVPRFALDLAPFLIPRREVDSAGSGSIEVFSDHPPYGFGAVAGFML